VEEEPFMLAVEVRVGMLPMPQKLSLHKHILLLLEEVELVQLLIMPEE